MRNQPFSCPINRRKFLKSALAASCVIPNMARGLGGENEKLILSAPLTHSDWILKAGMAWGDAGVRHMLDACKACGWSRVYWRALAGGHALYKRPLQECSGSFSLSGIKVQSTQMEEDVRLEALFVPIAKGLFDQPLDFIV